MSCRKEGYVDSTGRGDVEKYVLLDPAASVHASFILKAEDENSSDDLGSAPAREVSPLPNDALITGRVIDENGDALAGVNVLVAIPATDMRFVHPGSGHVTLSAQSADNGLFQIRFPLDTPTTIALDAMKPGFSTACGTLRGGGEVREFVVGPSGMAHASFVLSKALYVAGVVSNKRGMPMANVQIVAVDRYPSGYGNIRTIATDDFGFFEIFDFPLTKSRGDSKGQITFHHPDFSPVSIDDVYSLTKEQREHMQVILP